MDGSSQRLLWRRAKGSHQPGRRLGRCVRPFPPAAQHQPCASLRGCLPRGRRLQLQDHRCGIEAEPEPPGLPNLLQRPYLGMGSLRQVTPRQMSCHVKSCHATRHVMLCHVTPRQMSCHVMSCHVMSCHATRHVMSCHVMSCHVSPCTRKHTAAEAQHGILCVQSCSPGRTQTKLTTWRIAASCCPAISLQSA